MHEIASTDIFLSWTPACTEWFDPLTCLGMATPLTKNTGIVRKTIFSFLICNTELKYSKHKIPYILI